MSAPKLQTVNDAGAVLRAIVVEHLTADDVREMDHVYERAKAMAPPRGLQLLSGAAADLERYASDGRPELIAALRAFHATMSPAPDIGRTLASLWGWGRWGRTVGGPFLPRRRKRRLLLWLGRGEIDRLNALRPHFCNATRAHLARAFVLLGLDLAEAQIKATKRPSEEQVKATTEASTDGDES